jgi:hypothetical protein
MMCSASESVRLRPDPDGGIEGPRDVSRDRSARIPDALAPAVFPRRMRQSLNCDMQARLRGANALKCRSNVILPGRTMPIRAVIGHFKTAVIATSICRGLHIAGSGRDDIACDLRSNFRCCRACSIIFFFVTREAKGRSNRQIWRVRSVTVMADA